MTLRRQFASLRALAYLLSVAACLLVVRPAVAAPPLFPRPLHLTREIVDPISGATARVEEYYFANRAVTIRDPRTVIADYDRRELTEIDRANATFSITAFEEMAKARLPRPAAYAAGSSTKVTVQPKGSDRGAGRDVEIFEGVDEAGTLRAEVSVDSTFDLSRDAFDVIAGSAFPNERGQAVDIARTAARRNVARTQSSGAQPAGSYALPLQLTLRWTEGGRVIELVNRVVRIGDEAAPPDLLAIPPGARRVETHAIQVKRSMNQIDAITPSRPEP